MLPSDWAGIPSRSSRQRALGAVAHLGTRAALRAARLLRALLAHGWQRGQAALSHRVHGWGRACDNNE